MCGYGDTCGVGVTMCAPYWDKPERAFSLTSSTVALSVWYVGPFGPQGKFWHNILIRGLQRA